MFDASSQIVAKEGVKSLFKGAGANILRGVAGAGVLSLYDKLQQVMFGKVYSGGMCILFCFNVAVLTLNHRIWLNAHDLLDSYIRISLLVLLFIFHLVRLPTIDSVVNSRLLSVVEVPRIPPYKFSYSRQGIKKVILRSTSCV